jgi:hypothetical protein
VPGAESVSSCPPCLANNNYPGCDIPGFAAGDDRGVGAAMGEPGEVNGGQPEHPNP